MLYPGHFGPSQSGWLSFRWAGGAVRLFLLGLALAVPAASRGAERGPHRHVVDVWNIDKELPGNTVHSIVQTRDGYLWFGTLSGLVRFDGLHCTPFDEHNTRGLTSSQIVNVFEDRQGGLWVGTETGDILLFKDGQITNPLGIGQTAKGFSRRLASVCEDAGGAIWLYTADGQLWRHAQGRFTPYFFGFRILSSCRSVIAEPGGPVWVGASWGQAAVPGDAAGATLELREDPTLRGSLNFLLASRTNGYWRCLADGTIQKCRGNTVARGFGPYPWAEGGGTVSAACEDRDGNLIVGTRTNGVYWLDAGGLYERISTRQGLPPGKILSLCMDRQGNLWAGTDGGGLGRIKPQLFEVVDQAQGLTQSAVQSVCEDARGGLWIGLNEEGGANYWRQGLSKAYGKDEGLRYPYVWTVFVDRSQTVWAGTAGGGVYRLEDDLFKAVGGPAWIYAIHQDRQGRLWFGTKDGLTRYQTHQWHPVTAAEGLPVDEVHAIADDAQGGVWVGTAGGGLYRFVEGQLPPWRQQEGLPNDNISSLFCDADNVLWISTRGRGLVRFFGGKWTRYTAREGLASNNLSYLIEDREGYLWIGSAAGIMRVKKRELNQFAQGAIRLVSCRSYDKADGLPTKECTMLSQPGACLDRDGKLWLATAKGLVGVYPKDLKPNPLAPRVVIEDVLVDGLEQNATLWRVPLSQTVVVPPGKERLEIRYTGLNLAAADKCRFQYFLEGHETAWKEARNERSASYTKLPPRRYTFRVRACNEDGLWDETGSHLEIWVQPPIWRTGWFLTLTATVLIGGGVGIVHYLSTQKLQRQLERMHQREALEKERQRIAQDIHDQLGANLTSVTMLSELVESDKESPEEVGAHARQIAQTTRDTTRILDEIVWAVNPTNDTLESLMSYACKHAQEFLALAGLKYRLDMPGQLPQVILPPEFRHNVFLAFKEAITNIVRHAGATSVFVRVRVDTAGMILEIEDDGRGLAGLDEKKLLTRNGVRGMQKRLAAIGGTFTITPRAGKGTLVRLSAPFEKTG